MVPQRVTIALTFHEYDKPGLARVAEAIESVQAGLRTLAPPEAVLAVEGELEVEQRAFAGLSVTASSR